MEWTRTTVLSKVSITTKQQMTDMLLSNNSRRRDSHLTNFQRLVRACGSSLGSKARRVHLLDTYIVNTFAISERELRIKKEILELELLREQFILAYQLNIAHT